MECSQNKSEYDDQNTYWVDAFIGDWGVMLDIDKDTNISSSLLFGKETNP